MNQFGHGQSNPTFLIEVGSGTLAKKYVLRKKPYGNLLASAHAVEREYEVVNSVSLMDLFIITYSQSVM